MKKIFIICLLLFLVFFFGESKQVKAENANDKIIDYTEIIDGLALDEISSVFQDGEYYNSLKGETFSSKIKNLILDDNIDFFQFVISLFTDEIKQIIPLLVILLIVSVLGGMKDLIKSDSGKMSDMSYFAIYLVNVSLLAVTFTQITLSVNDCIKKISVQSETIFPIILSLLSFSGQTSSVAVFSPALPIIAIITDKIIVGVMFPLITGITVSTMLSNLSNSVKLGKFTELLASAFKWIIGIVLGVFTLFMTIKGLCADKTDGVSRFALKYLTGSIPVVGGFLRDSSSVFVLSSLVVKNTLGKFFLFSVFFEMSKPLVTLIALNFLLKLIASISEPFLDGKIVALQSGMAKSFTYYIGVVLMIFFVYFVMITLSMVSGGVV